jgi:hypothetical protein
MQDETHTNSDPSTELLNEDTQKTLMNQIREHGETGCCFCGCMYLMITLIVTAASEGNQQPQKESQQQEEMEEHHNREDVKDPENAEDQQQEQEQDPEKREDQEEEVGGGGEKPEDRQQQQQEEGDPEIIGDKQKEGGAGGADKTECQQEQAEDVKLDSATSAAVSVPSESSVSPSSSPKTPHRISIVRCSSSTFMDKVGVESCDSLDCELPFIILDCIFLLLM